MTAATAQLSTVEQAQADVRRAWRAFRALALDLTVSETSEQVRDAEIDYTRAQARLRQAREDGA